MKWRLEKLWLTLKDIFMRMKSFLNYFALKMILLNILQNFTIYLLFCFTHYDYFSKWYISILQEKLKFLVLHFTKFFLKIMFTKLLLDKGSSTLYVRTKIAKIRPPLPPLYVILRTRLDPSLCVRTFYIINPSAPPNKFLFRFKYLSLTISRSFSFLLVSEFKFH